MVKVDPEVPWCTVFLVVAALSCHSLVLYGNVETASAMESIGTSTAGWSKVGQGLARSFRGELDVLMGEITDKLSESINKTMGVQKYLDVVVSLVGNSTDHAGKEAKKALLLQGPNAVGTLPDTIISGVKKTMENVLHKLTEELDLFLKAIKPALLKVGAMIIKFGDKITQVLESFSLTLDKVQKMFDQIMAQLNSGKKAAIKEEMMHDTYTLFDVSNTGFVSVKDLVDAGTIYSISALQGDKPKHLVKKYDSNNDKQLDKKEFALFVDDASIPKSMAVVLRAYAKRLSAVAGNVAAAKKRDEVAIAVTKYFQLVCAKNKTKLAWVADALGNGSLPLPFTADIFKNLAQQVDNPDVLTTADVGAVVIKTMMELHPKQVMKAVDLMSQTKFWVSEGFDLKDQPVSIKRVTKWISDAKKKTGVALIETEEDDVLGAMHEMASMVAEENVARHLSEEHAECAAQRAALFSTDSSQYLLQHLLGGVAATDGSSDAAKRAVNAGVPAKPETLRFAQYLSANASSTADRFQKQSFEYTSESSSALDSFANQIQGMVKKITGFIRLMEKYSTPAGISKIEDQISHFAAKAGDDMIKVVNKKLKKVVGAGAPQLQKAIDTALNFTGHSLGAKVAEAVADPILNAMKPPVEKILGEVLNNTEGGVMIGDMLADAVSGKLKDMAGDLVGEQASKFLNDSINKGIARAADLVGSAVHSAEAATAPALVGTATDLDTYDEDLHQDLHGVFEQIGTLLRTMVKALPQATDNLKFAKQEVGEVAKIMDSVFIHFEHKGPSIFDNIAFLWKVLWSLYFVLLLPMTLGLLYYGLWASGYFGGPKPVPTAVEDGPRTWYSCLRNCCSACGACMTGCHDTQLCFWSCIILLEVVCLLIFVMSLVLTILAGVQAFMVSGCSQVYLLADDKICLETIKVLKNFQESFYVSDPVLEKSLDSVCSNNNLLTCDLISTKMKGSAVHTVVGGFVASVLSFQMIIESACLHTQARYRRTIAAMGKNDEDIVNY